MTWTYNDEPYDTISNNRLIGFVYLITNDTKDKMYIGQKSMYNRTGTTYKESDWRTYNGSNKQLITDIDNGDMISKQIRYLCVTKNEMNYLEAKMILDNNALTDDRYYNQWLSVKVTGKDVTKWYQRDQYLGDST